MYKPLMDWFDEHEGRAKGSSHAAVKKERIRQGYDKAKSKALKKKTYQHGKTVNPAKGAKEVEGYKSDLKSAMSHLKPFKPK